MAQRLATECQFTKLPGLECGESRIDMGTLQLGILFNPLPITPCFNSNTNSILIILLSCTNLQQQEVIIYVYEMKVVLSVSVNSGMELYQTKDTNKKITINCHYSRIMSYMNQYHLSLILTAEKALVPILFPQPTL